MLTPGRELAAEEEPEFRRVVREAFAEAGIRMSDRWWAEVPLDDPRVVAPVVDRLERLARAGVARPGSGHLSFWLEDDAEAPLEWFELDPSRVFPIRRAAPVKEVSAGDLPRGCHVAHGGWEHYVSEAFKVAVEEERLTGIELLWVRDVGRFRAPQWYEAIAISAIGRGLDHPWFDRSAYEAWWQPGGDSLPVIESAIATSRGAERKAFEAKKDDLLRRRAEAAASPARRFGARQFDNRFFKPEAGFGDAERNRLLRLFPREGRLASLSVAGPPIVLRRFLPATDFAFSWGEWEGHARDEADVGGRLCFKRRTRDVLLRRKLVRADECRGVRILDEPPPGATVFDAPGFPPPPRLTAEQLARHRVEEARDWKRFLSRPRKERAVTLEASLRNLKALRRRQPEALGRPARPKALDRVEAELGRPLPAAWRAVLQIADGFEPDSDDEPCRILSSTELAAFHRETLEWVEYTEGRSQADVLYVGHWQAGDLLALVVPAGERLDNCPVLRVGHEGLTEDRRWPGVAEFLYELLA